MNKEEYGKIKHLYRYVEILRKLKKIFELEPEQQLEAIKLISGSLEICDDKFIIDKFHIRKAINIDKVLTKLYQVIQDRIVPISTVEKNYYLFMMNFNQFIPAVLKDRNFEFITTYKFDGRYKRGDIEMKYIDDEDHLLLYFSWNFIRDKVMQYRKNKNKK